MKRQLLIVLLLCAVFTGCAQKPSPPATEPTRPDGAEATQPTQAQTKTVYVRTESTTQTGNTVTRNEYVLDDSQKVYRVLIYTDGVQTRQYNVECDSHGNYVLWRSGDSQIRYTYNEQGQPVSYCAYVGELLISSTEYTWENGLRTGIRQSVQGSELRTAMTYDENGKLLRQDSYTNGELTDYCVYTLGDDGRASVMSVYLADGTLTKTVTYAYDGNTVTATASDGSYSQQLYDDFGNLLSDTEYSADGTVTSRQTHSWKAIEVALDSLRASM